MIKTLYLLTFLFLCAFHSHAQTYVTQDIEKDTEWKRENSPYIITTDLQVLYGATLSIEAGTKVLFSRETSMVVYGQIHASGSPFNKIHFKGFNDQNWHGLTFHHSKKEGEDRSYFTHCHFVGNGASPRKLFTISGRLVQLDKCTVEHCYTAINTQKRGEASIIDTQFKHCFRAINVRSTSLAHVDQCRFTKCNSIFLGGTVHFSNNHLKSSSNVGVNSGVIVNMRGGGIVTIEKNIFSNFKLHALEITKMNQKSTLVCQNNTFKKNKVHVVISSNLYDDRIRFQANNFLQYENCNVLIQSPEDQNLTYLKFENNFWNQRTIKEINPTIKCVHNSDLGVSLKTPSNSRNK